MRDRLYTHLNQ